MTDKELLELAAKAAGMKFKSNQVDPHGYEVQESDEPYGPRPWRSWNPLTDDGDALRLLIKLELNIEFDVFDNEINVFGGEYIDIQEPVGDDYGRATRQVIVRAAAEIGRTL